MKPIILIRSIILFMLVLVACSPTSPNPLPTVAEQANFNPDPTSVESKPVELATATPSGSESTSREHTSVPGSVAEAFYTWYFAQPQAEVINDRTYANSPYLSSIAVSDISYLLDGFKDSSGYDPFTCSQNSLPGLEIGPVFESGGEANVLATVQIDGQLRHYFVIQMSTSEGDWKVDAIRCSFDPTSAVVAFYTWYLGNIYADSDAQTPQATTSNPRAEGKLSEAFPVSSGFLERVNSAADENADPIFFAQTVPYQVWVDPIAAGDQVAVRLTFGPQASLHYMVKVVQSAQLGWVVDDIQPVEWDSFDPSAHLEVDLSTWPTYRNPDFQFEIRYPAGWQISEADLSDMPADDPLELRLFFVPSWAEAHLPVLTLDILKTSEEGLSSYYPVENHQRVKINQQVVGVDRAGCDTRFIFQHPALEDTWIVVGDACSNQAGRERYAVELEKVLAPLLRSLQFEIQ